MPYAELHILFKLKDEASAELAKFNKNLDACRDSAFRMSGGVDNASGAMSRMAVLEKSLQTPLQQIEAGMKQVSQQMSEARQRIQETSAAWMALAKVSGVVGGAITASMGLMVRSAEEQRISIAQLSNMLDNVGVSYAGVRKELEASMTATARKTGISDEAQREALSRLIMVTGNYTNSLKALPVALDLAAARGIDAASAAMVLGRAMSGNTTMLKRYGINVKEGATSLEALTAVQNAVGGSAVAMASPFAILKNEMSELGESIGTVVLPAISGLVKLLTTLLAPIKFVVEHTGMFGKVLVFLTGVLGLATLAVAAYAVAQAKGLIVSMAQIRVLMGLAAAHIKETAVQWAATAATIARTVATTALSVAMGVYIALATAAGVVSLPLTVAIGAIVAVAVAAAAAIAGIVMGLKWLIDRFGGTKKAASETAEAIRKLKEEQASLSQALVDQQAKIDDANEELKRLQALYADIERGSVEYRVEVKRLNDAIAAGESEMKGYQDQIDLAEKAITDLEKSTAKAYATINRLSTPKLEGMGAVEDQIFGLDQQINKLKLAQEKLGVAPARGSALRNWQREYDAIQKLIDPLEKQRAIISLTASTTFDPMIRQAELAGEAATNVLAGLPPDGEVTLDFALAGIDEAFADLLAYRAETAKLQGDVDDYTNAFNLASTAVNNNKTTLEGLLAGVKAQLDPITAQITAMEDRVAHMTFDFDTDPAIASLESLMIEAEKVLAKLAEIKQIQVEKKQAAEEKWKASGTPLWETLFPWGGLAAGVSSIWKGLQTGGIETKPTLAVFGEAGPEAVLPLKNISRTKTILKQAMAYIPQSSRNEIVKVISGGREFATGAMFGGPTYAPAMNYSGGVSQVYNVYVNAGTIMAEKDLTRTIREELLRIKSRNYTTGL